MAIKSNRKSRRHPDNSDKVQAKPCNDVPNTYKFAAEALKTMSERGGSAGSIVVGKYKNYNVKHIYALVMNTLKNIKLIKKLIHELKLIKKVQTVIDNPFLLEILVGELLYGRGLKSLEQYSPAAALLGLKDPILKQRDALKKTHSPEDDPSSQAKYLRINDLKATMSHIIAQLKAVGLTQLDYSKDKIKFKKFINKFKTMENNQFMADFHFPESLLILTHEGSQKLKKNEIIRAGKAMFQDKASLMAVEAMDVQPNQKIIDACFAPGGKTSLIACKLKNKGQILAYDIDKQRLLQAKHQLELQGVTCAKVEIQDFSKVKLGRLLKANQGEKFDSILIDPSCSGSGIRTRVDYSKTDKEIGRLKKLQAFQVSLLRHALKAQVSRKIVYCTCSVSVEENEEVVKMALEESGCASSWDIEEVLPYWQHRGDESYEFGKSCLRSDASDLTNGFFIAKFSLKDATGGEAPIADSDQDGD